MEIGELDGEMAYAELASVSGRPEEAEKAYRRVLGGNPTSAREAAAFGMIELARRKPNEAKQYFERSMQLPDTPAEAFFEYAMLVRDSGGSRELVRRNLEMAVSRNPNYAEAHFLLGLSAANEGRHAEAIPHLEQAVSIFPRQSPFWHALAFSLHAAGRSEEARRAAQRALDSAANPQQAEMARAAVRLTGTPRPAAAAKAADVVVPESWRNPKGDSSIDGVLERIDCLGPSARFHIRAGGKPVAVFVQNPGEVLLKNLSSMTFEFRCGPQKPVPVVVEYKRQPDAEKGTVGVVTGIEFR
jgi:tetratricopeptide (TPR) repeat protein